MAISWSESSALLCRERHTSCHRHVRRPSVCRESSLITILELPSAGRETAIEPEEAIGRQHSNTWAPLWAQVCRVTLSTRSLVSSLSLSFALPLSAWWLIIVWLGRSRFAFNLCAHTASARCEWMNLTFFELEHFALASWMLLIVYDIRMRCARLVRLELRLMLEDR